MFTLKAKAKLIAAAIIAAAILSLLIACWSMNKTIGRLKTELQSAQTATVSAHAALAVESSRFQSYRQAAETLSVQMQAAEAEAGQNRARLSDGIKQHQDWANTPIPAEIQAAIE